MDVSVTAHLNTGAVDFGIFNLAGTEVAGSSDGNGLVDGQSGVASLAVQSTDTYLVRVSAGNDTQGQYDLSVIGADPDVDTDGDGRPDAYETDTGVYESPTNTGTSLFWFDTEGDGVGETR